MKRLLREPVAPPDVRPAMLSVWVALLLLLLPFLLLTTSPEKLTQVALHLAGQGAGATPPTGVLDDVTVRVQGADVVVDAAVRKTDVRAQAGDVDHRVVTVPGVGGAVDRSGLQDALVGVKALDPGHTRVHVVPDDGMSTQDLVSVLDAVRERQGEPLFPDVVLGEPGGEGPP